MCGSSRAAEEAFTLIELLVVVAIIGILAAILLPVLSTAKLRAMTVKCVSNQNQLAKAWIMYSDDNNDYIVGFDNISPNDWICIPNQKPVTLPASMSDQRKHLALLEECYKEGAIFPYTGGNLDLIHCPADSRVRSPVAAGGSVTAIASTAPGYYAYGSYSGTAGLNGQSGFGVTALKRRSALMHPGERFLWLEENDPRSENRNSWTLNLSGNQANNYAGTSFSDSVASWHIHDSNFSFADGHAENRRWIDPSTIAYALNMNPNKYTGQPTIAQSPHDMYYLAVRYPGVENP